MKRVIIIIATIATVHFAIMYFTTASTISHNLDRTFTLIGSPPAKTPLTVLTSHTSAVLRQPLEFFLSVLPTTEPKEETASDKFGFWVLLVLNSILWGATIYFVGYGFRKRFHRQQAA